MKIELTRSRIKERRIIGKTYNIPISVSKNSPKYFSLNQIYDSLFGAFFILAYVFEIIIDPEIKKERVNVYSYITRMIHIFGPLKVVFLTRLGMYTLKELSIELNTMKFTHEQRAYIEKWVTNETHLVKK